MKLRSWFSLAAAGVLAVLMAWGLEASGVRPVGDRSACVQPAAPVWEQVHECTYRMRVESGWLYNCFIVDEPMVITSVFVPDPSCIR